MKYKIFTRLIMIFAMVVVMAGSGAISCSAHPSNPNGRKDTAISKDSIMRKAVGDSIYTIIFKAKRIRANVIRMEMDSVSLQDGIFIKSKYIPLVKFVLSAPEIYKSNTPVYGAFMPSFSLTFMVKGETCTVKFDFGLKKWAVFDCEGVCLKTFDLASDDMLRVADLLFPDNKYFQSLINSGKK